MLLEEEMGKVLVAESLDDLRIRQQHDRTELVARTREDDLVEIGQRHDQAYVVLLDERAQSRDVPRVVDPRDKGMLVGVVERGRKRVGIRRNGSGACPAEGVHDVDALSGTREENGRHGGQYSRNGRLASAEAARTAATTGRTRPGNLSIAYPKASAQAGAVVSM